jgi:gliding motility-associated-like protein
MLKRICLLQLLTVLLGYHVDSQVIFSEPFDEPNTSTAGVDNTGGVAWTSTCPTCLAGDYFYVNGGLFEGNDTNGDAVWETNSIDISGCSVIDISIDISEVGDMEACGTGCNSVDWVYMQYNIDGGGWQDPANSFACTGACAGINVIQADDIAGGSLTYTATCIPGGTTMQLRIGVQNWAATEFWQVDNVTVSCGTLPNLQITDPSPICGPSTVDLTDPAVTNGSDPGALTYWQDDQATIPLVSPNIIGTGGTYYIQLDAGGCTVLDSAVVVIYTPDDPTFSMTPECNGATAIVSGTIGGTFTFATPPGDAAQIDPLSGTITNATNGTTYEVQYLTNGPCPDSSTVQVITIIGDDPTFSLTPSCTGATATIIGTAGGTFSFATPPGDGAQINSGTGEITGGISGTTYDIHYLTNGLCPDSLTLSVSILPSDDPSFTLIPTCDGATAVVNGTIGGQFSFNIIPSDNAIIDPITGTISGGEQTTVYTVTYQTNGVCFDTLTQNVTSEFCPDNIVIPTAFTPNQDLVNDDWQILHLDANYPNSLITIYNRWGNMIYSHQASPSEPYTGNAWDGTFKGKPLPVGSYYFVIDPNDGSETIIGTVSIIMN